MASSSSPSSSSSSNMALPRANGSKYDVFLSFRGEDTRHSFTDHLYAALVQAGILAFRDSDDAERGEELKQEIENAIKASDASIIVLSGNYATSTWCLDELSLILDQRKDCNHFVLPVFYNVDPSNVGKQKGSFEIQADPSKRRWTDDNVNRWKAALTEVVGVIGMTLVGSETKFIKEVVDTIYNRLDRKQIHIPANITGMDVRYEEINLLLKQSEAQFLVICGMAGSGKSTMAQYIVYKDSQQFESNSIVEKIGTRCKNSHEMVVLQEQLCSDISKGKQDRRIDTVCKGTAHIEVLLKKTKALIVLDEIVEERHLEELLGSGNINKESKIIITTNNDISNWFMSKSMRFQKYIMRLLNDDEALELLSLHAFRSKLPKDGYTELAQQVVRYCGGNPLALEVLGSSLSKNDTITSWESELSSFERSFHDRMYDIFIRSYNSLPSSCEKELFLHIACFFVGSDMNYVIKILDPDYGAESKIKTLTRRCFLYVTPDNKLMMHRLLQEMGRSLVDRKSSIISKRTRVWRNKDSYEILRRKKRSNTIEGLALDIQTLIKEDGFESMHLNELSTDSLQKMDQLKLLQLKFVKLTGSYKDLSEHLRWLCWVGFNESTVRTDINMGNMVALDMSYSYLREFEPPMYLPSLKILNLKDSHKLSEIRNFHEIPNLETLILWNCHDLLRVCRTIGNLQRLALLNMAGCKNLFNSVPIGTSGVESALEVSLPLPRSLQRVFLNDCNLECTNYFPLSFSDQSFLQYINLANGHFEILPSYNLLKNLRVLDLRKCSRLKRLLCLPSTLAELYIYDCKSIEKITFESGRFTLQEFGYEGCVLLSEIEGWVKLLLITKLDESDLGHMLWLKEYQHQEVCLVGDYELTKGRSWLLQMLYEFNIMSTSLPDIKHPQLTTEYTSPSTSLSFDVPRCPRSCRIKGLNVTFRYTISGDDWIWFVKIRTTNNVDLMYNPKVFGIPRSGNIGRWLSYWPIGNLLDVGDVVYVSIVVMRGLEVLECGASVVYTNDDVARDTMENKTGWVEAFGEDLYRFKLRDGSYYLCQRDIYKLTQVGRLTPGWLSILAGYTIDDTEVRGWRMTGRPQQSYQSFKELKTIRRIIHGPDTVEEQIGLVKQEVLASMKENLAADASTGVVKKLKLQFRNRIAPQVFTGMPLLSENQTPFEIALVDAQTGQIVTTGVESTAKVGIMGFQVGEDDGSRAIEEFQETLMSGRKGKRVLQGKTFLQLKEGVGFLQSEIYFTHSSKYTKTGAYRLGAIVVDADLRNRIEVAWSETFVMKDKRFTYYEKHPYPLLSDGVCHLQHISYQGTRCTHMKAEGVKTVKDLLTLFYTDRKRLENILKLPAHSKIWNDIVTNALASNGLFLYLDPSNQQKTGVVLNVKLQLTALIVEPCVYVQVDNLSDEQKMDSRNLVKFASEHFEMLKAFEDEISLKEYLQSGISYTLLPTSNQSLGTFNILKEATTPYSQVTDALSGLTEQTKSMNNSNFHLGQSTNQTSAVTSQSERGKEKVPFDDETVEYK